MEGRKGNNRANNNNSSNNGTNGNNNGPKKGVHGFKSNGGGSITIAKTQ